MAIEISTAYTKEVSDNLGHARMVYDKSHVIQNVVEACDQVREAESRADFGKRGQLEGTRWIWVKNRVNRTEKETQKWESIAREAVRDGIGLRNQAGISRHLPVEGRRGDQEAGPELMCLGACGAGANRGVAGADGPSRPDDRGALGANLGPLDSMADDSLHGGTQQPVF